jgi:hypothetical protein
MDGSGQIWRLSAVETGQMLNSGAISLSAGLARIAMPRKLSEKATHFSLSGFEVRQNLRTELGAEIDLTVAEQRVDARSVSFRPRGSGVTVIPTTRAPPSV